MTEIPQFSMEDVLQVISEVPASHPVVEVLDQNSAQIKRIMDQANTMHSAEASRFTAINMCFLAKPIKQIGAFTLKPLDLVVIGARLDRLPRFRSFDTPITEISHIICAVFVTHGLSNPGWDQFPTYHLENIDRYRNLPPSVLNDREGLTYVKARTEELGSSFDQLREVVYGPNKPRLPVVDMLFNTFYFRYSSIDWEVTDALARLNTGSI